MEITAEEIRTYVEQQEIRFGRLIRDNEELKKEGEIMERLGVLEKDLKNKQDNTKTIIERMMKEWEERERIRMKKNELYISNQKLKSDSWNIVEDSSKIIKKLENIEDNLTAEIIDVGRRMGEKMDDSEIMIGRTITERMNDIGNIQRKGPDDKNTERGKEERTTEHTGTKSTYAEVLKERKTRVPKTLHSVIVTSDNPTDTSEQVLNRAKEKINAKKEGMKIDRIRKCKDQRIIIGCETVEQIRKIEDKLKKDKGLKVERIKNKDPLVILKDVFNDIEDDELISAIREQNENIFMGLPEEETIIKIKFKKSTKNKTTTHVALQVRPAL
ncbi:unnamed protein product [Diatraea saccharalis]|uniref:Uncharacterized protein n=1 Tax=Diatraea saccharalis TaxID=40085 RepID=A0A9N9R8W1_9NEOP|nr:unnamed protein product [Diatraea saccharalis]